MKLLILCVFIVANLSYNGKASLESFLPTTNSLLADTTKNSNQSCQRPCKFSVKPRRCVYSFEIEPAIQEDGRPALVVNGMTPGPPIHVCVNDVVIVKVKNRVPDQDLTIHWHGVEHKGTPYMDGVPMVTQCPISYGSTYEYAFIANAPGTHFYHSYSVAHQSDGVYGSLVIDQPQPLEPHNAMYDFNRPEENTFILAPKFTSLLTGNLEDLSPVRPSGLVVNGNEDSSKVFVIPGYAYRLRLINAAAIECPLLLNVDRHDMTVIASDGKPVRPAVARHVLLYPGERMDVVIRADQKPSGYWIRVRGQDKCEGLSAAAMLLYSGFNYTAMLQESREMDRHVELNTKLIVFGQKLRNLKDSSNRLEVTPVYLGINRNVVQFKDSDNDYRYISDILPKKPFYPAELAANNSVVQINGKNFLYPDTVMLLKPREVKPDNVCAVGEEEKQKQTQCIQALKVKDKRSYEIALVNEGFGSNESYTFHLHGYSAEIITTWKNPKNTPISKEDFLQIYYKKGKLIRNYKNPPLKDTFVVPNKGITILRVKPDRGGTWLLECRSCGFSSLPVAVLLDVPLVIPKLVIDSLPKCGNYKPADVLLN